MVSIVGGMIGGIGMLFFGMWLLSENLKTLTGPRIRSLVGRLAGNRFAGFGCGVLAGAVTQSSVAVTSVAVSMMRSEVITPRQGFLLVTGSQLGVSLLVLVVAFDIRLVALYGIGIAGIIVFRTRKVQYREIGGILFGVALLVFGLLLLKESSAPLTDHAWFQGALQTSTQSLVLSFVLGAVLTLVVQAGLPIVVFGIAMATQGIIEFEHILMFVYGVYTGLGFCILLVAANLTGISRRLAMFSAAQTFFPAVILIPLLYAEIFTGLPLVKEGALYLEIGLASQIALVIILYGTPSRIVILAFPDWTVRQFSRLWPGSPAEQLSRPQFIHDSALDDVETSLDLVYLEQKRLLSLLSGHLESVRTGGTHWEGAQPLRELRGRIDGFLSNLEARNPTRSIERRNAALSRQKLIAWLEDQFETLAATIREMPDDKSLGDLKTALVEGTDGAFLVFLDSLESGNESDWDLAERLIGDRRALMGSVRVRYIGAEQESGERRGNAGIAGILESTNSVENIFFLLAQLIREYRREGEGGM